MNSLNNNIRKILKVKIKKTIERKSNNKVVKIVLINESSAECHCLNRFNDNEPHIINILFNDRIIILIYENSIFTQVIL